MLIFFGFAIVVFGCGLRFRVFKGSSLLSVGVVRLFGSSRSF